jgi:hypothetical protein
MTTKKTEAKMTNVNYVTFKLPGREKTFTGTSISSCYRSFLQDYSEALPELLKVVVSYSYQSATGIKKSSEYIWKPKDFRDAFGSVERQIEGGI